MRRGPRATRERRARTSDDDVHEAELRSGRTVREGERMGAENDRDGEAAHRRGNGDADDRFGEVDRCRGLSHWCHATTKAQTGTGRRRPLRIGRRRWRRAMDHVSGVPRAGSMPRMIAVDRARVDSWRLGERRGEPQPPDGDESTDPSGRSHEAIIHGYPPRFASSGAARDRDGDQRSPGFAECLLDRPPIGDEPLELVLEHGSFPRRSKEARVGRLKDPAVLSGQVHPAHRLDVTMEHSAVVGGHDERRVRRGWRLVSQRGRRTANGAIGHETPRSVLASEQMPAIPQVSVRSRGVLKFVEDRCPILSGFGHGKRLERSNL
jgi:hypothetical protein